MSSLGSSRWNRSLRSEHLEDRRMLATVMVSNVTDVVDGDVFNIDALMADKGDDDSISLREAHPAA